jgi:hypothetical protein
LKVRRSMFRTDGFATVSKPQRPQRNTEESKHY